MAKKQKLLGFKEWIVIILAAGLLGSCFGGDKEEAAPISEPKESVAVVEQSSKQEIPKIDDPVEIEVEDSAEIEAEESAEEPEPVAEILTEEFAEEPVQVEEPNPVEEPEFVEESPVVEEAVIVPIPKPTMSVQQPSEPEEETSITVYITKTGKRYHHDGTCGNGEYIPSTLEKAESIGLTPCKKCVA